MKLKFLLCLQLCGKYNCDLNMEVHVSAVGRDSFSDIQTYNLSLITWKQSLPVRSLPP